MNSLYLIRVEETDGDDVLDPSFEIRVNDLDGEYLQDFETIEEAIQFAKEVIEAPNSCYSLLFVATETF